MRRARMKQNWMIVEALSHSRHDWLNKLQLIKGNLALGKVGQAENIIDGIIVEAQNESRVCNLKLPQFAEFLLLFNWQGYHYKLEFEIIDELGSLTVDDDAICEWMEYLTAILNASVVPLHDNLLYLMIEGDKNEVRFFFEFTGALQKIDAVTQWLTNEGSKWPKSVSIICQSDNQLTFEVYI